MKKIRSLLLIFIIVPIVMSLLSSCIREQEYKNIEEVNILNPVKIDVLLYRFDDKYIASVREELEKIQTENSDKVRFVFHDGKNDQALQNQSLDSVIKEGTDLLLVNLVDINTAQSVINKIKEANIPVVLFNREPNIPDQPIKSYNRAVFIGTDAKEAGVLQGEIILDEWNNNRNNMDKNADGILQYLMLTGERNNLEAIGRTKYSILTIQKAGVPTEELALRVGDWDRELARVATESVFFRYGNRIEAIIANNDDMAIGAIEALQARGYNKGDISRTIAVVGVDATDEAKDLIAKGFMKGTVIQDDYEMAKALYLVGMNLVQGKGPLDGTDYKFDETGVSIRIPYKEYMKK